MIRPGCQLHNNKVYWSGCLHVHEDVYDSCELARAPEAGVEVVVEMFTGVIIVGARWGLDEGELRLQGWSARLKILW
jgi:hypothetical protein